jgi:hypothetical protein
MKLFKKNRDLKVFKCVQISAFIFLLSMVLQKT